MKNSIIVYLWVKKLTSKEALLGYIIAGIDTVIILGDSFLSGKF